MAILAAIGASQPVDNDGALKVLVGMPLGSVLLWLVAAGLAAHGLLTFAGYNISEDFNRDICRTEEW